MINQKKKATEEAQAVEAIELLRRAFFDDRPVRASR